MCGFKYNAREWKLVGNKLMFDRVMEITYEIYRLDDGLTARAVHVRHPDKVLADDVEELKTLAVRAYLEAIGFGRRIVRWGPKPN